MLRPPQPDSDLETLKEIDPNVKRSNGVIDIKVNHVETPDKKAARIANAADADGPGRIGWVLIRSIANSEMDSLTKGKDRLLDR